MNKNEIITILNDWNFWKGKLNVGKERSSYRNRIQQFLKTNQIVVITGARRSGKSYIMRQSAKSLIADGVSEKEILMVNFDDPRFEELNTKTLQDIYETYLEFLNPKRKPYIFLDEVQEIEGWEKWVRMIHELGKANVIVSGSNARLLSRELSTLLTGRHLDITVFPLSFSEYLDFNDVAFNDKLDVVHNKLEIMRLFRSYLELGSFPEVVLAGEKKQILLNYFEDILNKDLIRRFKIRKTEKLKGLAKFYFSNISSPVTFNSIEKFLDVSADTVEKFSEYFETAYMLFFLKRFSFKIKQQEKSPKKVYAIDTGLANTAGFRFSQNLGRLAENIVLLELKRLQETDKDIEIFYWKDNTHREVDFVIKRDLAVKQLIQVCWDMNHHETRKREIQSLSKAMKEFKLDEGLIITEDYEGEEKIEEKRIRYVSLWQWLIQNSNPNIEQ
ncbi:MAG: ATP-binding protein [Nitrospirae bacterium]|nr:ATP-binding protein [Nitrospirota bacterium]